MTLTSIVSPKWVSYTVSSPSGGTVTNTIGLHRRCTYSPTGTCAPFPDEARCEGDGRSFCSMWRTTGFLMSFATVAELAAIVGFLIIMAGGRVKRQGGWKILGGLLAAVAAAEFVGMAVVVSLAASYLPTNVLGLMWERHICLIMMICFWCQDTGWTRRGICARPVRAWHCWRELAWPSRRLSCRRRMGMSCWVIRTGYDVGYEWL